MAPFKWAISAVLLVAVVLLVGLNYDLSNLAKDLSQLSAWTLAVLAAALLANTVLAALRFKVLSSDVGHPISFRHAMAAVSAGGLAGLVFFQIGGQLVARGFVMARARVPFASVVVVTAYERIIAAIVSGLLALAGAYFVFGSVYLDRSAGGGELIKIVFALVAASTAGAVLGYGRMATELVAPYITRHFVLRCARLVALTFFVQVPMMVAYVVAAQALSPQTGTAELIAASAIVMFAASLPISLAGWGIREMSAVFALGVIGVQGPAALLAAIIIGVGSILAMAFFAALSLPVLMARLDQPESRPVEQTIDYARALAWMIPITVAILVYFQIYLPIGSGTQLNVNLADPLAILGGSLFVLQHVQARKWPQWRLSSGNVALVALTAAMSLALLIGAFDFGWTRWAVVNRYTGWFMLLAYAGTGALIVKEGKVDGLRIMLLTFVGAGVSIAVIEISLLLLLNAGVPLALPLLPGLIEGFSQNHNFLAFQFLMAMVAAFVAAQGRFLRIILIAILIAGIWYSASRSGLLTLLFVLAAGVYMKAVTAREIGLALLCAGALALLPMILAPVAGASPIGIPELVVKPENTVERLSSIRGGLELFLKHPIFGAGLGAFRWGYNNVSDSRPLLIHSTYVWLMAELGLVGLVVFMLPALRVFYMAATDRDPDMAAKMIVLCLVVFGVMSLPADMVYQRTFWLLFGAALACTTFMKQRSVPGARADG